MAQIEHPSDTLEAEASAEGNNITLSRDVVYNALPDNPEEFFLPQDRSFIPNHSTAQKGEVQTQQKRDTNCYTLTNLRPHHYQIITLFLSGMKTSEIAARVKMSIFSVRGVLASPAAKELIEQSFQHEKDRLRALTTLGIDAIAAGLDEKQPVSIRLKAAKMQLETQGLFKPEKEDNNKTAEDVVKELLNVQLNVQINNGK